MPYVKGGGDNQVESLRALLNLVQAEPESDDVVAAVNRTRPTGFVERDGRQRWRVSAAGKTWLDSGDDDYLIAVLHSGVKFVGEILAQIEMGTLSHSDLVEIAKTEFGLAWTSADQVRRRTSWLRSAGMLDLRFDNYLEMTPRGGALVKKLILRAPNSERNPSELDVAAGAVDLSPAPSAVADLVLGLDEAVLGSRKRLIGFLPGGKNVVSAVKLTANACTGGMTKEEWISKFARDFDLKDTSAVQSLGSFRSMGLVEAIARDKYAATAAAAAWLETDDDVDLVRIVHANIRFVGEILARLSLSESTSELINEALTFEIPVGDLQRRLSLLIDCGLIEESGVRRHRLTPLGHALLADLPVETARSIDQGHSPSDSEESSECSLEQGAPSRAGREVDEVVEELTIAGRAATDHERLERAVAAAFSFMGYEAEHLGGPGRTDVRAVTTLSAERRFVVIADAKASSRGQVLPFDVVTLREHKLAHGADSVVVVGEIFGDRRTVDRSKSEGISLLPIATFGTILRGFNAGVLTVSDVNGILSTPGLIDNDQVSVASEASVRLMKIAKSVLSCLAEEAYADDEVTRGALAPDAVYMLLRNETISPTLQEIKTVLDFLSGPLVGCLERVGQSFVMIDHAAAVVRRLESLGKTLQGAYASGR